MVSPNIDLHWFPSRCFQDPFWSNVIFLERWIHSRSSVIMGYALSSEILVNNWKRFLHGRSVRVVLNYEIPWRLQLSHSEHDISLVFYKSASLSFVVYIYINMFSILNCLHSKDILPKKMKDESTKSSIAKFVNEVVMSDVLTHQWKGWTFSCK